MRSDFEFPEYDPEQHKPRPVASRGRQAGKVKRQPWIGWRSQTPAEVVFNLCRPRKPKSGRNAAA
jgi:hypothetical protein